MQNTETNTTETAAAGDYIDTLKREIENLREQVASADAAATRKSQELDAILSPLFSAMESRIEGIIADELETFRRDFDVSDYQSDIEYMISDAVGEAIDDRLPEPETDDDRQEAVESIVRDILAGATVTIDI